MKQRIHNHSCIKFKQQIPNKLWSRRGKQFFIDMTVWEIV